MSAKIFIRFRVFRHCHYRLQPFLPRNTQILESFCYINKKFEVTEISISVTVQILTFRLMKVVRNVPYETDATIFKAKVV